MPDWGRLQLWPEVVLGQPKQVGQGDCWRAGGGSEGAKVLGTADLCLPDPSMICWALHGQKLMRAELHCCWVSPKAIPLDGPPQLGVNCLK